MTEYSERNALDAMPKVPLVVPLVGDAEVDAVVRVLRSGQLAQGPEVAAFEQEFATAVGAGHAVAFNSGTAANHAALAAMDVGPGDVVLTTPFTFAATATPIVMQGATVRFVDIDERTFNLDPAATLAAAGPDVRAAVVVDLFGLPVDAALDALRARGVAVLEDACQAIGATRGPRAAGMLADAGSFSFYATKNVMTGEGGMLVTDDGDVAERTRRFRQHGMSAQYEYATLGYNYRMTDVAAAIGRVQLGRLADITARRRQNAAFYDEALADVPGIVTPHVPDGFTHAYHQYSILIDPERAPNGADRDAVRRVLSERGVSTGIYYPKPLHLHSLFAGTTYGPGDFPVAERVARRILALPIHPALTDVQRRAVVASLRVALGAPP